MVLRIATWNVENLFRPGADDGPSTMPAYEAKLKALAKTINVMAPDVLAVQEVGGDAELTDLAEAVGGEWHRHTAHPDGRGIRVGVLSRPPFTAVREVSAFAPGLRPVQVDDTQTPASTMGRAALHVTVTVAGHAVDVITCHLKSKLLTFPGGNFDTKDEGLRARFGAYALNRRAAEAATVRDAASGVLAGPDARLVVLGDLNDEPEAATTQILHGPPGSEIGTDGYDRADKGDGQRLWNLAARIPAEQRFSRVYHGRGELIDHILVSHALVTHVADGDVTTGGASAIPSVADDPRARRDDAGSDHRPVLAVIDL